MQCSSVNFLDLNNEFRIDAEYYRTEVLERLTKLETKKHSSLCDLVDFVVGPFGSTVTVEKYVDESDYRYIRNKDIIDYRISDSDPALIPKEDWSSLSQFHIRENDLLITVVGTLGKVAIATTKDCRSIFSCKITILRANNINPFYLLVYLNSDTGKLFSLRGKRGAIQEGLNLTDLKDVQVFDPSKKFQAMIERVVRQSFAHVEKSELLYKKSKQILLSELGLDNWHPEHKLTFIRNYSDTEQVGRIDAEYFQPRYDEIVQVIKGYNEGWDVLGNLVNFNDTNFNPIDDVEYDYIELSDIATNGEVNSCTRKQGRSLPSRARRHVAAGDVIISSIEGSLDRIALVTDQYDRALCSTGFHVIESNILNPETILVLLKSVVGRLQLKKGCSGTILTAINKDELSGIILPKIRPDLQKDIADKVRESFKLRKKSKQLLEAAKRAVEIGIEEDEETAEEWLEFKKEELGNTQK